MKNLRIVMLCLITASLLTACMQRTDTGKMHSKEGQAQCLQQCDNHYEACRQTCVNSCKKCRQTAFESAAKGYTKYCRQLQLQGGYDIRQLNSYRDPLKCRKTTCNCPADHVACRQSCTGKIYKKLRTAPVCT